METGVVIVTSAYPSKEGATNSAKSLINAKLAACVHVHPVSSTYRWEGRLMESEEFVLSAKTTAEMVPALSEHICKGHPYELPEILVTPVIGGDERYLNWVKSEAKL